MESYSSPYSPDPLAGVILSGGHRRNLKRKISQGKDVRKGRERKGKGGGIAPWLLGIDAIFVKWLL